MKKRVSSLALGILAASFIGQGLLQRGFIFDKWSKDYSGKVGDASGLAPDQMLFALVGFRELIAGILWVRADSFFDSGNYDAILPIIRLVTILDPHQIDVFATGMWHIGYNFTDEEQRSDRRYIPSALALGAEGARQNPKTYEMYFETGWMWYHKIDDNYDKAVKWFLDARKQDDMIEARKNLLGMAYQRSGEVEKGLATYQELYDKASEKYEKEKDYSSRQNRETIEGNIDTMLVRMVQRGYIAGKEGRPLNGYDVHPPFDVGFSVKASVVDPRVIRFEGTWNVLPVGTRVRVVLRDANYTMDVDGKEVDITQPAGLLWDFSGSVNLDPPRDRTFMQDQLFVRNRRFNRKVDMSKDPTMYPFTSDDYVLEFYYNPRSAPPHIQDKFSWNGEGMTDKNYLNTEVRPGQRVVFCQIKVSRDQILRRGEWQDRTPVLKTPNYVEQDKATNKDDVIVDIPSLRSGG
ncbi:MAG: tetratricopeptide repeat protein [Fimbriimonas sp.]